MSHIDAALAGHLLRGLITAVGCLGAGIILCCLLGPWLSSWRKARREM